MAAIVTLVTAARPCIATSTAVPGLSALRTAVSAHGARLISGGTMGVTSTSTATTSFAAPTVTIKLATATTTATPAMSTTVVVAERVEHLSPALGTSEREHLAPTPRASEQVHHADRAEHRRGGSQFHRLADRVRHLQDQQRNQTVNSQRAGQNRDHGVASACQRRPLRPRDARGARELPLHGQVLRPLHQVQGGILHLDEG